MSRINGYTIFWIDRGSFSCKKNIEQKRCYGGLEIIFTEGVRGQPLNAMLKEKHHPSVRAPYSANVRSLVRTDTFSLRASAMIIRSNGSRCTRGRVAAEMAILVILAQSFAGSAAIQRKVCVSIRSVPKNYKHGA
jgi:hypothetical protein